MIDTDKIKAIVEAALLAADSPLMAEQLVRLFPSSEMPRADARELVKAALDELEGDSKGRGVELKRVASGYRMQVKQELSPWVSRLWDEKPPRYSRALLETLSLVAYRQPVTRGDIEQVRGVAVSQNIMRTLTERGWVKVVGQREVPGRPSLYGTTKAFLDYFNLKSLNQLPPLAEIRELIEPVVVEETQAPGAVEGEQLAATVSEGEPVTPDGEHEAGADIDRDPAPTVDADLDMDEGSIASQDVVAEVEFAAVDEDHAASVTTEQDATQIDEALGANSDQADGDGLVSAEVVQLPRAPRSS